MAYETVRLVLLLDNYLKFVTLSILAKSENGLCAMLFYCCIFCVQLYLN